MPNLICSVENCFYNADHLCALNKIHVSGTNAEESHSTSCRSFVERGDSFHNSVSLSNAKKRTDVDCEAKNCIYNEEYHCYADGLNVCGCGSHTSKGTECATFELR